MTIAVYFTEPDSSGPPFEKPEYVRAYHSFAKRIMGKGGKFCIARSMDTFLGNGTFSRGWMFDGQSFHEHSGPIHADTVFNKGEDFRADADTHVINRPELDAACMKDRTYELFPQFCPQTFIVRSDEEFAETLGKIHSKIVVVKPPHLGAGKGVHIGRREDLRSLPKAYPLLVQEFIDTSAGIPGIVEGMHDLRLILIEGGIIICYLRTPPSGEFIANRARGGTLRIIPQHLIPHEASAIAQNIDASLSSIPERVYSVDLGRDRSGTWKLIELNSPPGLTDLDVHPDAETYHEALAELLMTPRFLSTTST